MDREALKIAYDIVDSSMKKIIDLFKKKNAPFAPTRSVLAIITTLATRWEPLKKYQNYNLHYIFFITNLNTPFFFLENTLSSLKIMTIQL